MPLMHMEQQKINSDSIGLSEFNAYGTAVAAEAEINSVAIQLMRLQ